MIATVALGVAPTSSAAVTWELCGKAGGWQQKLRGWGPPSGARPLSLCGMVKLGTTGPVGAKSSTPPGCCGDGGAWKTPHRCSHAPSSSGVEGL